MAATAQSKQEKAPAPRKKLTSGETTMHIFGGPEEKFDAASSQRMDFFRHREHTRVRPIVPDLQASDLHSVSAGKKLDATQKTVVDPALKDAYNKARVEQLANMKGKGAPAKGGHQAAEALGAAPGAKMEALTETMGQYARKVEKDVPASVARHPDMGRTTCPAAVNPITGERRTLPLPPFEQPAATLGGAGRRSVNADARLAHRRAHPSPI